MTTSERHAILAQAAYLRNRRDRQALADKYFNGEYELLADFSDKEHTTFKKRDSSEIVFAVRGTDISNAQGGRMKDLATDVLVTLGVEAISPRYRRADKMLAGLREAHPEANVSVTGHSLGGTIAQGLGWSHDLESHAFNPGASPLHAHGLKHKALHPGTAAKKERNHVYLTKPGGVTEFDPISISASVNPLANLHWIEQKDLPRREQGVLAAHSVAHFAPESAIQ